MSDGLVAVVAAAVGVLIGIATHRLNQLLAQGEAEATNQPLPREYLWAPIIDGALFGLMVARHGVTPRSLAALGFIALLTQVAVFDARHRLILNRVMYPAAPLALALATVNPLITGPLTDRLISSGLGAVIGGGAFFLIVLISRGAVGMGDAKLSFVIGATLGLFPLLTSPTIRALLYGVLIGGAAALLLLATRLRGRRDFIPYGPFLCAGAALELLLFV